MKRSLALSFVLLGCTPSASSPHHEKPAREQKDPVPEDAVQREDEESSPPSTEVEEKSMVEMRWSKNQYWFVRYRVRALDMSAVTRGARDPHPFYRTYLWRFRVTRTVPTVVVEVNAVNLDTNEIAPLPSAEIRLSAGGALVGFTALPGTPDEQVTTVEPKQPYLALRRETAIAGLPLWWPSFPIEPDPKEFDGTLRQRVIEDAGVVEVRVEVGQKPEGEDPTEPPGDTPMVERWQSPPYRELVTRFDPSRPWWWTTMRVDFRPWWDRVHGYHVRGEIVDWDGVSRLRRAELEDWGDPKPVLTKEEQEEQERLEAFQKNMEKLRGPNPSWY